MTPQDSVLNQASSPFSRSGEIGAEAWRQHVKELGGPSFLAQLCRKAAEAIMAIYTRGPATEIEKSNGSPLTEADLASAAIIERELVKYSGLPVVCEESTTGEVPEGAMFWLVDPLDGTKEFINRNGEFTINIALVAHREPVVGIIAAPATGDLFFAVKGEGAHWVRNDKQIQIRNARTTSELTAAISRSHAASSLLGYLNACGITETIERGSALKFCELARGTCDTYVRIGRTMEWDTAAGQCLLEEAHCKVLVAADGTRLAYGKPNFANPSFIASRSNLDLPWNFD
jgi:3'(2'), 5'-bisphosphate nucleotidase